MNKGHFLVEMVGICKGFSGVQVLQDCRLRLKEGEIHALCGENGAGKSTLMKILTGVYTKDRGQLFYRGREVEIRTVLQARRMGICRIPQELQLMPDLTVAANIFIGREALKRGGLLLDDRRMVQEARQVLARLGLSIDPATPVGALPIAKRQLVEIAKALSFESEVLVLDEPSSSLTEREVCELFRVMKELRKKGVALVYISHRMDEIKEICDTVTVLRDGEFIGTAPLAELSVDRIIQMMVGRSLSEGQKRERVVLEEAALELRALRRGSVGRGVSFKLKKGESRGMAGLVGAGRTEIARALFGADPIDGGEILVDGRRVAITSPQEAVRRGIAYLPEDRGRHGLILPLSIEVNTVMTCLKEYLKGAFLLDRKKALFFAQKMIANLRIKATGPQQVAQTLSGGNQQKVVISKWLASKADILIFDEPTRGIDVGAKREIYKLIEALADQGKAIIVISSELPEVLRLSDRILVVAEGRIQGELPFGEATQEGILELAMGGRL